MWLFSGDGKHEGRKYFDAPYFGFTTVCLQCFLCHSMQKWITLIPIFILELNLEEFQNGKVEKNDHRKKQYFYDIFLLASFICVRTVMLYATRISIVLSVFLQVLWKSEAISTFWGRTAQATSARTTMTTASTRKTVNYIAYTMMAKAKEV